jgi:hypothetical protein
MKNSRRLRMTFCWLLVAIPLGWGVWQSIQKSLPLFAPAKAKSSAPKQDAHP